MKYFVIAKPNARAEKVEKIDANTFRVCVKEPPQKDKANKAILKLLSSYLKIPLSKIRLLTGATSKFKYLVID